MNRRSAPFRRLALGIAATTIVTLSIVQCSDFSLYGLLAGERGGELTPAARAVNIEVTSTYRAGASGGFEPYAFSVSGNGSPARGSIDPHTGVYTAPETLPDGHDFTNDSIVITDYVGTAVAVTVRSFARLRATPQSATVNTGDDIVFTISGGVPPYDAAVADEHGAADSARGDATVGGDQVTFNAPPDPGKSLIVVSDQIENEIVVTVHVVDSGSPLAIAPATAEIGFDAVVHFSITGGDSPYTTTVAPALFGTLDGAGTDSPKYTAPALGPEGVATITVTDSVDAQVSATVFVVAAPPDELVVVPALVEIRPNASATFTVSGGVPGYAYALQPDRGSLTVNGATAVYTAAGTPGNVRLIVTDQSGQETSATIRVRN